MLGTGKASVVMFGVTKLNALRTKGQCVIGGETVGKDTSKAPRDGLGAVQAQLVIIGREVIGSTVAAAITIVALVAVLYAQSTHTRWVYEEAGRTFRAVCGVMAGLAVLGAELTGAILGNKVPHHTILTHIVTGALQAILLAFSASSINKSEVLVALVAGVAIRAIRAEIETRFA